MFVYPLDQTLRKRKISYKFQPYVEKHGLVELFSHLTRKIIIEKPKDVLTFIRNQLVVQQQRRGDILKIILLAPPHIDRLIIAEYVCQQMSYIPITVSDIVNNVQKSTSLTGYESSRNFDRPPSNQNLPLSSKAMAQMLIRFLNENEKPESSIKGCIFVDFPRDKQEAQCLLDHNVVPTHVISLVHDSKVKVTSLRFQNYKSILLELKQVYQNFFIEICFCDEDTHHLGDKIIQTIRVPMYKFIRVTPKVILLGPRGSGRRSLGEKLSENLKVIHFDMTRIFAYKGVKTDEEKCQTLLINLGEDICLERGYVLTGFPRNVDEFRLLDQSQNPPNRIIFLSLNDDICLKRHGERCFNIYTGQKNSKNRIVDEKHKQCMKQEVASHPDDDVWKIKADLRAYRMEEPAMMRYIGRSAILIDASCCMNSLYERVMKAVIGPTLEHHDRLCESVSPSQSGEHSEDVPDKEIPLHDTNKFNFTMPFQCKVSSDEDIQEKIKNIFKEY